MAFMQLPREKVGKQEMKLAVVGSGGVGKSALTIRFVTSHFYDQGYNPTIEDSYRKQVVVNDEAVTLEILDTAGQEEYAAMANQWYKYASGFLLVYSITDRVSFENLLALHEDILRVKDRPSVPVIVLSNKCDLSNQRTVAQADGRDLARSFGAPFIECSAAEGVNVDVAFRQLVKLVRKDERKIATQHAQILSGPISGPGIISPYRGTPLPTPSSTLTSHLTPSTPSTSTTPRTPSRRPKSPSSPLASSRPRPARASPTRRATSPYKKESDGGVEKEGCCVVM